ncbi:VWA domain-containing protein [Candidatus Woesearchaeota archaeon]|nr:VWA domain-containing protein [Candidatus Woesearchaeota archaeon]
MEPDMEIFFVNPHYLWLLAPIPIFAGVMLLFLKKGKRDIEKIISFHALDFFFKKGEFLSSYSKKKIFTFVIMLMAYSLILFAISGATAYYKGTPNEQAAVMAIDASGSMLAEDIDPNRLEAVKSTLYLFLEKVPSGSRIAIISFSGNAYIEQGLSGTEGNDAEEFILLMGEGKEKVVTEEELSSIVDSIDIIEDIQISPLSGTSIVRTLETSANILKDETNPKQVILISDGSENIMGKKELDNILESMSREHITVNTIGVGKAGDASLQGKMKPLTLDEETLRDIAEKTGGSYYRAETKQSLAEAYERLSEAELKIPLRLDLPLAILSILLLLVDYIFIRVF